jgi:Fe2+ transport system protein FeoA
MAQGESAKVAYLHGRGPVVHRLRQFGILPGAEITVVRYAPLRDPIEINVYGALVSLRIQEAFHVVMSDGRED